eukprot:CAMPEP_0195531852 /NCGR_PEP_ID=MMETSP0794_2-20130614/36507_1 /TAXON_ID=515487 /ORGANISM="Stephanopyxis turris, Strain CCMP 815" /LENGTH=843 /DNA_ID=CAMNT_0040663807 /DNA_START=252 /DNA_END=2783 /DNA_ORIENTATION=-
MSTQQNPPNPHGPAGGAHGPPGGGPPGGLPPGVYPPNSNGGSNNPPPDSYFTESRKGEVNELRQLLSNFNVERDQNRKRDIIKKVIAYMTLGIDVSRLFSEMMMAIETRDLVVKKMVYLFLCNYATANPELAQMCTNTLQKDCSNDDPMVRGLALRALCSLNLPEMVEYISEPLRKSLTDHHGYVRKTGVMGILKLWHLDKEVFERCNFIDVLYDMLRDSDVNVVSNCILVLNEIMAKSDDGGMAINRPIILHLLNRIHEFSEFGILAVLNLVPRYRPANEEELYQIMNLLDPLLRTSNSGAVLATVQGFLSLSSQFEGKDVMQRQIVERVKAPILTLATGGTPELVYCLFKHVDMLISLCPNAFDDEYRQFYVRYNEPTHVQYLKVQILAKLVSPFNAADIVAELGEYVCDADSHLSRLAVRSLARVARSNAGGEGCAETIVHKLVEFLDLDIGHVSAEAANALKDVIRKHPSLRNIMAPPLTRALRFVSEPVGKASVIWLLGEMGDIIHEAPYSLEKLINSYDDIQDPGIKIALLTATMKLFFKRPPEVQKMLGKLLKVATDDVSSHDLHDRALLYHRLLKTSPKTVEVVVCGSSPTVSLDQRFTEEDNTEKNKELMKEFNTLAIMYGQTAENFIAPEYQIKFVMMSEDQVDAGPVEQLNVTPAPPPVATDTEALQDQFQQTDISEPPAPAPSAVDTVVDLLGFGDPAPVVAAPPTSSIALSSNVNMDGDAYQSLWGAQANPILSLQIPLRNLPSTTTDVESSLANVNILTMASGELPTELKFFLYAQEAPAGVTFLLQLVVKKPPSAIQLDVEIKTSPGGDREKADQLVELMKGALAAYV